ncbi:Rad9-domain-containing protein [Dendryphion nanum]|uniref:DNA repair protein rad9 n=1 Tax=Dendryphion nanum TaxID=256645 RepID=A0A9P9EIU9_9PLEO|nr:Rad9-domain-containing protein [Dendryphion nanum]
MMVVLNFTLTPEAASRIHDLLICLGKFSDTVAIEARRERFTFTALNSSKSAYAAISLDGKQFFSSYECIPSQGGPDGRFTCSMYTKALLSVFKSRLYDPLGRDGAIDRCEVSVQDRPDETQCRFIVKMVCNQGVVKTYKLTYESVEVFHALFDKNVALNRWTMAAAAIKEYIEYFGTKTEMLDIYSGDDGRAVFKSYTEKITNGKEILKHPLVTAVAVNTSDFEDFDVANGLHIIISVKDFKAIVVHADSMGASLKAFYSHPTRPLQFSYTKEGMTCEFTLMTSGDHNASAVSTSISAQIHNASRQNTSTSTSTTSSRAQSISHPSLTNKKMPPPPSPARRSLRRNRHNAPSAPSPAVAPTDQQQEEEEEDPESLFVRQDDEDAQWEPIDYNNEEETLGWDASVDRENAVFPTFRDSGSLARTETGTGTEGSGDGEAERETEAVAPTQRVSQVRGLW